MNDPRRAAAAALMKQEQNGYANLVLQHVLEEFKGSARDRAFLSAVFYGTVERMITLDYILQKFLQKPLIKLDAAVRAVLRSGLYQARFMDHVPVRAAIYESVTLIRQMGKSSAAGLVNAVLRRAAEYDLSAQVFEDEVQRLSVQYSVTREIAQLLLEKCPQECEEILKASFVQPRLCLRVNPLQTDEAQLTAEFEKQKVPVEKGHIKGSLYVDFKGDITALKLFRRGAFHVQGEASQMACAALCVKPGEKVLDLCAAPGGKSATLCEDMKDRGTLISCDAAKNRLSLIRAAFERIGVSCAQVLENDASVYRDDFSNADAVLCDVPCSGLGVLAKKPDIRNKTLEGLQELVLLQQSILETASRYVRPGGRLVYSTCTLNPDENAGVVTAFLARHPEFTVLPIPNPIPGTDMTDHFATLYPHKTGTDGFFVALMQKKK